MIAADSYRGIVSTQNYSRSLKVHSAQTFILCLIMALNLLSGCTEELSVQGTPKIIDGDTIKIGETTIRIYGIDAPEFGQECVDRYGKSYRCGQHAKAALTNLIKHRKLKCDVRAEDDYFRKISVCYADGKDIGEWMIENGQAWAFVKYSSDYIDQEEKARIQKAGIWQANNTPPWKYRKMRWKVGQQDTPEGCPIKGNISKNGARIYHTPWSPSYHRTSINERNGERWFCSESEAIKAGWRAPH